MRQAKRRKMFIDPAVQGALLRRLLLHWACFAIGSCLMILILQVMVQGIEHPFWYHAQQIWQQYGIFFLVMICFLPAFVFDSIKLSHRFAGPIYKLRITLKSMADGEDVDELRFRRSDYWQEIATDVNRISDRLRKQEQRGEPQEEALETSGV